MGFNYSREKFIFDREWENLHEQYKKVGMREKVIHELYDFDWSWFCMRRNYENRVQALPEEGIDEQRAETRSNLFQKFASLSTSFDEMDLSGRYAWIDTISGDALSRKLRDLSDYELELLTLLALEGYTQR
nr:RNA polymerase subunit sigma-70 [Sedimentibacter sp.]